MITRASLPFPAALALAFAFALASTPPARSAAENDLGQNLAYLRTLELADDLPALERALTTKPALILDFRATRADSSTANSLRALFAKSLPPSTASTRPIRLILVGEKTAPSILTALKSRSDGVVTLGLASASPSLDVPIIVSSADDLRAFDALVAGTAPEKLINATPAKERFDEAKLVRDHANTQSRSTATDSDEDGPDEETPPTPAVSPAPPETPRLIDLVLSRAVQIHRALIALKRL